MKASVAFARIGLFAAAAAVAGSFAAAWVWLAPAVALAALFGGLVLALAATVELEPVFRAPVVEEAADTAEASPDLRVVDRGEIEARARRAREELEGDAG